MTVIEGFNHRIARLVVGMTERKGEGGEWEWALVDAALETTETWTIREYVRRWQVKIMEYVSGRPIYKLCAIKECMEGYIRFLRCWYQEYGHNHTEKDVE